jgi:hypothetical protein
MDPNVKRNWTRITAKVSQGPIDDPALEGAKALTKIKGINLNHFTSNVVNKPDKAAPKWILHPESSTKLTWDIICMVCIIFLAITVPYKICFNIVYLGVWAYIDLMMTVFFMLDFVLSFNTGFYAKGALVMDRKLILKNYARFWLWMDMLATIPYTWFVDGVFESNNSTTSDSGGASIYKAPQLLRLVRMTRFLRVLRLLRLAKLKKILMKIEDYIASNTLATLFVFARLLSVVFFIAHWTACWWYFISTQDMMIYPLTWITKAKIENESNSVKYITALYWAFTTMTTVGYGDITPITNNEKIYAMFSMIVACGVFAYTVGSIGSLVSKQNAMENAYREQVVAVNRYMRKKELPYDLQFRVRRYLEYVWENKKRNNLDEKQILKLLSEPLRDEIYAHIHGIVLKLCPIFDKYEPHFIGQVTRALESETYAPGDTVIEEGEMSSKIYFIQNGKVDIFHHSTKSTFKELGPNQYFGEIAFFTERPRCASAKCLDFVDLLSLSRSCMNELLEKFPEAKEITAELCKACEDGDYSALLVKCYICTKPGHFAIKCKNILLNYDHEETKNKWLNMRNRPNEKMVKPSDVEEPKFKRNVRKRIKMQVNSRAVIGVRKDSEKLFPDDQHLYPKIKNFMEKYSVEGTVSKGRNEKQRPMTMNRPKFTLIYKDSEGNEEDEELNSEEEAKKYRIFDESPMINSSVQITPQDSVIRDGDGEKNKEDSSLSEELSQIEAKLFEQSFTPVRIDSFSKVQQTDVPTVSPVTLLLPPKK